jgi:hypothetical protein
MVPALTAAQSHTAASSGSSFRFGAIYMPNGVFPVTTEYTESTESTETYNLGGLDDLGRSGPSSADTWH